MFGIGMLELLLILVVGFLLFNSKKLPEMGSGLGRAVRNLRRSASASDEIDITPKEGQSPDQEDSHKK